MRKENAAQNCTCGICGTGQYFEAECTVTIQGHDPRSLILVSVESPYAL